LFTLDPIKTIIKRFSKDISSKNMESKRKENSNTILKRQKKMNK
jgi:hypothetical protein